MRSESIYNHPAMKTLAVAILLPLCCLTACNNSAGPAAPPSSAASSSSSAMSPDAVQQKLQEYSGAGATNCGRLDVHADAAALKTASDCAMQANQSKRPFYVAYDMPGMAVGVAGNSEAKLFTVQSEGAGPTPTLTSGDCPSELRVASSGRVTCHAPGDMGSMGGGHTAGAVPPGMSNPHAALATKPRADNR